MDREQDRDPDLSPSVPRFISNSFFLVETGVTVGEKRVRDERHNVDTNPHIRLKPFCNRLTKLTDTVKSMSTKDGFKRPIHRKNETKRRGKTVVRHRSQEVTKSLWTVDRCDYTKSTFVSANLSFTEMTFYGDLSWRLFERETVSMTKRGKIEPNRMGIYRGMPNNPKTIIRIRFY